MRYFSIFVLFASWAYFGRTTEPEAQALNATFQGQVDESTTNVTQDKMFDNDIRYLSGLPIDKLLRIKKQLEQLTLDQTAKSSDPSGYLLNPIYEPETDEGQIYASDSGFTPMRGQTLHGQVHINYHNPTHAPDVGYITPQPYTVDVKKTAHEPWEQKPSKIQTIFQVSVTALSFLAFAAYLLCMIVTASRSNGTTYFASKMPMVSPVKLPSGDVPVPIKKRKPSYGRRKRSTSASEFNPDEMFLALTNLAEGYVKFNNNVYLAAS